MAVYSDLSNGELLGQLRELALEARDRVADYVDRAKDSDEALHTGFVFARKVEAALHPSRGSLDGVYWLKHDLEEIAAARPDEPADGEWDEFLEGHPELADARENHEKAVGPVELAYSDDDVLAALAKSLEDRALTRKALGKGSYDTAWSSCVAHVLLGDRMPPLSVSGRGGPHSIVVRVGRRLSALAKQGRVVQLRPRGGGGSCQWTVPGRELSDWTRQHTIIVAG